MSDCLFVYGTLHPDRAPSEIAEVVKGLTPVGSGTIRGKLYSFDEYPGVILDDSTNEKVHGEVFTLPDDPDALLRLDQYEEYDPYDLERSLFKRVRTTVTLRNGSSESCWVYVYNQASPRKSD
jgi:gamma-glutamylcyclotransferase (GGCT)/AIG2-like uncharacterized protein YtfP